MAANPALSITRAVITSHAFGSTRCVAERPCDPGTRRGDGGESRALDHAGRDHVPRVREHEDAAFSMEPAEGLRALPLTHRFHRPSWLIADGAAPIRYR